MARMMMSNATADTSAENTATKVVSQEKTTSKPEDTNRYAHTFADWDLVPPQVVIRRVSRIKK